MLAFILPSENEVLLEHMTALAAFLDDLHALIYAKEMAALEGVRFAVVCRCIWGWHNDVKARTERMTSLYAIAYLLSWSGFARIFHLCVAVNEEKLLSYTARPAREYAYASETNARKLTILSSERLGLYSITDLWNATRLIFPTLYTHTYSRAMKEYVHALFFRYCDLLSCEQAQPEEIFDNPLFVEDGGAAVEAEAHLEEETEELFDAFKRVSISVNENYSINNSFLYDGEQLFYHQLYRMNLSTRLETLLSAGSNRLTLQYGQQSRVALVRRALLAWRQMVVGVAEDKQLSQYVINDFRTQLIDVHMYHGEKEHFKRCFPESACANRNVLMDSRPNEVAFTNLIQAMPIRAVIDTYYEAQNALLEEGGPMPAVFVAPIYEQEALLLTRIVTNIWYLANEVADREAFREGIVLEEMVELDQLEALVRARASSQKRMPLLMKLVRIYYVVDHAGGGRIFHSTHFIEAYLVWLALCLQNKVLVDTRRRTERLLHPEMAALVESVCKILVKL
jgi:hypothetical protein